MIHNIVVGALAVNCWVVPLDETTPACSGLKPSAVIDPGDDADEIIALLDREKLYVHYILLTHGHFDHIMAVKDIFEHYKTETFSPVIAIGKGDASYLDPAASLILNEGDTVGPFKVLHLPGHTEGSVGFYDEKKARLFSGDTLFKNGMGRTDLPGGNWEKLADSLRRLFSMDGAIRVSPGHGPETTIAAEAVLY